MKICEKCGAINSDNRLFCMDCNEILGDSVSENQKEKIENEIDSKIDNLYSDNDPLAVTLFDKIMGLISLLGIVICFALWIIELFTVYDFENLGYSLLFFIIGASEAFIPKLTWAVEKLRLSLYITNSDDAQPNSFYKICRKVSIILTVIFGVLILVSAFSGYSSVDDIDNLNIVQAPYGNIEF